jgi:hypothetical protein
MIPVVCVVVIGIAAAGLIEQRRYLRRLAAMRRANIEAARRRAQFTSVKVFPDDAA